MAGKWHGTDVYVKRLEQELAYFKLLRDAAHNNEKADYARGARDVLIWAIRLIKGENYE